MQFFDDISDARRAIAAFLIGSAATLPAPVREAVQEQAASASPVDQICNLAELLYAHREVIGADGMRLAGRLAAFAGANSWHELRDGRGRAIALAMMRDLGEESPLGASFTSPADDPAPSARFTTES